MEVVHGLEVCVLAFAQIRACVGKELECPGVRSDSGRACTSASTSQVLVEICARTPRETGLAWWELQPARSGNRNRLPHSPAGSGTFSCSQYRGLAVFGRIRG